MKKVMYLGLIALGVMISGSVSAQTTDAKVKKEIKKEVKVEEVNGEKVLTIKKMQDGKVVSEEVHRGDEADKRIAQMEKREEMRKNKQTHPPKARKPHAKPMRDKHIEIEKKEVPANTPEK
jgi:hypothetical protein